MNNSVGIIFSLTYIPKRTPFWGVSTAINLWDYINIFPLFEKKVTFNVSNIDEIKTYFQTISSGPLRFPSKHVSFAIDEGQTIVRIHLPLVWIFFLMVASRKKIQLGFLFEGRNQLLCDAIVKCQISTPLQQIVFKWNHSMWE